MELSSSKIESKWKPFLLGCIAGSLLILLFHSQAHDYASFLIAKNTTQTQHSEYVIDGSIGKEDTRQVQTTSSSIGKVETPLVQTRNDPIGINIESPQVQTSSPTGNEETPQVESTSSPIEKVETPLEQKSCNIFQGRWVYKPNQEGGGDDPNNYSIKECPFLGTAANCRKNGRPDFEFEKWRWQPIDCDIPSFNARDMAERLKGKRMIVAGDSIGRSQWESLACLMYASLPPSTVMTIPGRGSDSSIKALDYNFTLEYYASTHLLDIEISPKSGKKVLKLDKLHHSSDWWQGADVMLFNSGHWWYTARWDVLEYNGKVSNMPKYEAYKIGMKTWAKWVSDNVDQTKTRVFFRGMSPTHFGKHWCFNKTQPIKDESYRSTTFTQFIEAIEKVIEETNTKTRLIKYLNVTKLSDYRQDAHNSVYKSTLWKDARQNFTVLGSLADCSHWCLPGLPDTWNRLLYASLLFDSSSK